MMNHPIVQALWRQRNAIAACGRDLFRGTETIEELAAIFRTPQAQEFCLQHDFPTIETWRELAKEHDIARFGIYVDAGHVELRNEPFIALVGQTTAELSYDELKRHNVLLLHGARATVEASAWAVVFVSEGAGCEVVKNATDRAKVL